MNQRLIWNFEFTPLQSDYLSTFEDKKENHIKWEIRYFWPDNKPVILNAIDSSLLSMTQYQHKYKEDYYYLLPKKNYNIKKRRNQLIYKPLVKKMGDVFGFGAKITLNSFQEPTHKAKLIEPHLLKIIQQITKEHTEVVVKKEIFSYKFSTKPKIKMELARLEILNHIYFSLCVEGKSLYLVKTISEHLLEERVSCDYVTFLKNLLKLC